MEPSELRRLAEDHAHGRLNEGDYRARRRALIDAITTGESPIHRSPPEDEAADQMPAPRRRIPWLPATVIAGILAIVVLIGFGNPEPRSEAPATMAQEVSAPRSTVTPARALVESFLAKRNFSIEAVQGFEEAWDELRGADHRQARETSWFSSLGGAIDTEIRTQLALAELGNDPLPGERAARLRRFATHIGIAVSADTVGEAAEPERVERVQSIDANQWLAIQPQGNTTLQLFAVNALAHVGRLMERYRQLDLHVLRTRGSPRYRVVHGSFADVASARRAYDELPEAVRDAAGGAIVKSMAALRDDLDAPAPEVRKAAQIAYTLQLFATRNETNALALVKAHPELELRAVRIEDPRAPHRVVLGRFTDIEDARKARDALPATLVSRVGRPLIKRMDTLGIQ